MVRKKIAIITPLLASGGMERVSANLSKLLSEYFRVYLIVFNSKNIDYDYSGELLDLNIDLNERSILKRTMNTFKVVKKLRFLKEELKFDYTISMGEISNIPNILSGGKKNILTVHENRFNAKNDFQRKLINKLIKYAYRSKNIYKIVVVSKDIEYDMRMKLKLPSQKLQTIYNPFDIDSIRKKATEPIEEKFQKIFKDNKILINVGRLTFSKGQWYLLRIFNELRKVIQNIKLVILGDGELREELIALSKQLGLKTFSVWENNSGRSMDNFDVYFLGFKKNPYKYMYNSFIFISTSLWEGLPNVIIEALACNAAVIYSNCKSGPLEILAPQDSYAKVSGNVIFGDYGVLLPPFKKQFIIDSFLTEEEKIWVESLKKILTSNKLINIYRTKAINRAMKFNYSDILKEWLLLLK